MARPLLSKAALMVVINPFAAPLDEKGRPCTIIQYDPDHTPAGSVRRIGCSLDRKPLKDERYHPKGVEATPSQYPRFDTTVVFDLGAKPVIHSVYHVGLIKDGSLLPADEATATLCGGKFNPPAEALSVALSAAVEAWLLEHPGANIDPKAWLDAGQFAGWFAPPAKPSDAKPATDPDDIAFAAEERAVQALKAAADALTEGVARGKAAAAKVIEARMARAEKLANRFRAAATPAPRGEL